MDEVDHVLVSMVDVVVEEACVGGFGLDLRHHNLTDLLIYYNRRMPPAPI